MSTNTTAMHALVYHGPGKKAWEEVPKPDDPGRHRRHRPRRRRHDLRHRPAHPQGRRPRGHRRPHPRPRGGRHRRGRSAPGVKNVKVGDRVLVSCITACGALPLLPRGPLRPVPRRRRLDPRPPIDGTQAEYVRVPFADTSTYPVPAGVTDEAVLMLADILPTGYEVGVLNGQVRPGDVVAVVGAGPIGLSAIMGARLFSPAHVVAIDLADSRLEAAKQFGADVTVNNSREDAVAVVRELTDGLGADVAIEAVGVPATFELCAELVRPGGHVANIGVHGEPATLHLEDLWIKNVTITTGLVDTYSTPTLLRLLAAHQLDVARFVTHHFALDDFIEAYDVFARAATPAR